MEVLVLGNLRVLMNAGLQKPILMPMPQVHACQPSCTQRGPNLHLWRLEQSNVKYYAVRR